MAIWPCMYGGERFEGDARNVYLTLWRGSDRLQLRYVVCPEHEDELLAPWIAKALYKDELLGWTAWEEGASTDALFQPVGNAQPQWSGVSAGTSRPWRAPR